MTAEPIFNIDKGLARVVTSLENQVTSTPVIRGRVDLYDVLALVETMRAIAGSKQLDGDCERIQGAAAAIDSAVADIATPGRQATGLLAVEPSEVYDRVRQAAFERAAHESLAFRISERFQDRLALDAATALRPHCDAVVTKSRAAFDAHAKVVLEAHVQGLSSATDTSHLLDNGSPAELEAYRALPRAVAGLDQLATLRTQMRDTLNYGPAEPPVAAFVTDIADQLEMQGAWNAWVGETEIVQYNQSFVGSTLAQVHRRRLGGAWLALVNGGHTLRLNTADETQSVIDKARAGKVA